MTGQIGVYNTCRDYVAVVASAVDRLRCPLVIEYDMQNTLIDEVLDQYGDDDADDIPLLMVQSGTTVDTTIIRDHASSIVTTPGTNITVLLSNMAGRRLMVTLVPHVPTIHTIEGLHRLLTVCSERYRIITVGCDGLGMVDTLDVNVHRDSILGVLARIRRRSPNAAPIVMLVPPDLDVSMCHDDHNTSIVRVAIDSSMQYVDRRGVQ